MAILFEPDHLIETEQTTLSLGSVDPSVEKIIRPWVHSHRTENTMIFFCIRCTCDQVYPDVSLFVHIIYVSADTIMCLLILWSICWLCFCWYHLYLLWYHYLLIPLHICWYHYVSVWCQSAPTGNRVIPTSFYNVYFCEDTCDAKYNNDALTESYVFLIFLCIWFLCYNDHWRFGCCSSMFGNTLSPR